MKNLGYFEAKNDAFNFFFEVIFLIKIQLIVVDLIEADYCKH